VQIAAMPERVSSKEIQAARRIAKRTRSAVACFRCRVGKTKCSDYRPCKGCVNSKKSDSCVPEDSESYRKWKKIHSEQTIPERIVSLQDDNQAVVPPADGEAELISILYSAPFRPLIAQDMLSMSMQDFRKQHPFHDFIHAVPQLLIASDQALLPAKLLPQFLPATHSFIGHVSSTVDQTPNREYASFAPPALPGNLHMMTSNPLPLPSLTETLRLLTALSVP
jgi:hypothetical protein